MYKETVMPGVHAYDGYVGERFWRTAENESTYDDPIRDSQCVIPMRDVKEIREDLRKKYAETE